MDWVRMINQAIAFMEERLTVEYLLTASKSVPAFKAGNVGEENKWITLHAYMAKE